MSSRDWRLRIQDILLAIQSIQQRTTDTDFDEFAADETMIKAVLYDFIVIGEASASIPLEQQVRYSQLPWRSMKDMRNVVAHEYFQIDLPTVWRTIHRSLPPLIEPLQAILEA
ncbi:hypothetical protein C7271_13385 [filamentous cyanobacterium CCP5]|nr:hypothetical protein C7293_31305 [filamentous cyanobacterium CCT1]PSN18276.1 hypothetical protein C7271_13385 [filamentous cyanobacterium CCP5]